jgi:hypothetical protein
MALAKSILGGRTPLRPKSIAPSNTNTQRFLSKALGDKGGAFSLAKSMKVDKSEVKTGAGKDTISYDVAPPKPTGKGPPTDVWGISVGAFADGLAKCGEMTKSEEWIGALPMMRDGSQGLLALADNPPPELLNLARLLQQISQHTMALPYLSKQAAEETMQMMGSDLQKMASEFSKAIPGELKGKPLRPPGSKSIAALEIQFPQQYLGL